MEKQTNIYQCPPTSYKYLLSEIQANQKADKDAPKSHFTFLEWVIVLVIIGVFAVLGGPSIYPINNGTSRDAASAQLSNIETAMGTYLLDMRKFPSKLEELIENKSNNPAWNGPYLKKSQLKDIWGNLYQYHFPGYHNDYDLYSYGADGIRGGEGDNADRVSW